MSDTALKEYTITSGNYETYRIVAQLLGPTSPDIHDLYQEFKSKYFPYYKNYEVFPKDAAGLRDYNRNSDYKYEVIKKLKSFGYEGESLSMLFVSWLKLDKNFEELNSNEYWVED